ncbi:MAG: flagellar basal body L-ring protein FlgH [Thermodesulfobacteriota bacterium]
MHKLALFFLLAVGVLLSGCAAQHEPQFGPDTKAPSKIEPAEPEPAGEGSLWNKKDVNIFSDNKAQAAGDIVTVAISEEAQASKDANTETGRNSNINAGIYNLLGIPKSQAISNSNVDMEEELLNAEFENSFEGDGETSRNANLSATIATQVIERLPNGNLRIFGRKRVMVNNEEEFIGLSGIIRPEDINAQNMVESQYVLDAEITYTGQGAISDKQKPGWLMRLIDNVWPF